MLKSRKVMTLFILFLTTLIVILPNKSVQSVWLESGEYIKIYSLDQIDKKYIINWEYDAINHYGTTSNIFVEIWVMDYESHTAWDKVDMENIPGQLLSTGYNDSGKFRITSDGTWYVIIYNKPHSIDIIITYNVDFNYEPLFGMKQKILFITIPTALVLSGVFIPLSIRWGKKAKQRRILRKNKIDALIQESINETLEQIGSTTPVSLERIIDYTKKILKTKAKNDSTLNLIPSLVLAKSVCENYISLILAQNVDLGEYYKVEQVFVKTQTDSMTTIETTRKATNCYYCGSPFEESNTICTTCKKEVITCAVCKLPIRFGESTGKCSLCEKAAHLNHIQEWVKTKGMCPSCLQEIPLEGILIEDSISEKQIEK